MKIIRIGADAYKVKLTREELQDYGLYYLSINCQDSQTLLLLEDILNEISRSYGTDYLPDRMLIEFFPAERGGCYTYLALKRQYGEKTEGGKHHIFVFQDLRQLKFFLNHHPASFLKSYACLGRYYVCFSGEDRPFPLWAAEWGTQIVLSEQSWSIFAEYAVEITPDLK